MTYATPVSLDTDAQWLDLSDAARFLGVHFTTLRRWADAGKAPCYRTAGGRRRFRRDELAAFLADTHHGASRALALLPERVNPADIRMRHLEAADEAWYQKIGELQRDRMRRGGRDLMALLMQYATRAGGGEAYLQEGQRLAAQYGRACHEADLTLVETLQAFLHVRHAIFDSVYEAGALAGSPDTDNWRLYHRMNAFLDAMLLATVEAHSQALLPDRSSQCGQAR
jgi:excisionase family DNA binding protein